MKKKMTQRIASLMLITAGFVVAPAFAIPITASLKIDAWAVAVSDGFSFEDLQEAQNYILAGTGTDPVINLPFALSLPNVSDTAVATMDGLYDKYGLMLGLQYTIESNDPAPTTSRSWDLRIDFNLNAASFGENGLEFYDTDLERLLGTEFPNPFPISDLFGTFSVENLAELGQSIYNPIFDACAQGGSAGFGSETTFGACFFESSNPKEGTLWLGLKYDATNTMMQMFNNTNFGALYAQASLDLTLTQTTPTGVVEPSTLALFGLGLVGIGLTRRHKKA
jgi:hypothetical protein